MNRDSKNNFYFRIYRVGTKRIFFEKYSVDIPYARHWCKLKKTFFIETFNGKKTCTEFHGNICSGSEDI